MDLSHNVCAFTPLGDTASCSVVSATHDTEHLQTQSGMCSGGCAADWTLSST